MFLIFFTNTDDLCDFLIFVEININKSVFSNLNTEKGSFVYCYLIFVTLLKLRPHFSAAVEGG